MIVQSFKIYSFSNELHLPENNYIFEEDSDGDDYLNNGYIHHDVPMKESEFKVFFKNSDNG